MCVTPRRALNEMRLGNDEFGGEAHTYCPAYTPADIGKFLAGEHPSYIQLTLSVGVVSARMWSVEAIAPRIPDNKRASAPD